jgi:hypothetical protein
VDTVEWGTVEPARRRLPTLKYTIPRAGALVLTAAGFAALVAAELMPWGIVHLPPSAADTVRPTRSLFTERTGLTLDSINNADVMTYHLGAVVLLGAIGFGLAGSAVRRRAVMGAALGIAAGLFVAVISLNHAVSHFFDSVTGYFTYNGSGEATDAPTVATGAGAYLAYVGVGLLAAAAVTAGIWQRGWWQSRSATPAGEPANALPPGGPIPEAERELTVSPLEPAGEKYFARPDRRQVS